MKKTLLTSIIAAALFLVPVVAHADGYVCDVLEYNYSGFGNYGGLLIIFYSGPHCTGSFQNVSYACSTGSNTNVCSASSYYTYSEAQLMTIFHELNESGRTGHPVAYYMNPNDCKGAGPCLENLEFEMF